MNALAVCFCIFACAFGGSLLGIFLRTRLPDHHLSSETKDTVKLGMGLVGTMTALLLSLLVASAKSSYDQKRDEITQVAAKVAFLDRVLANIGPQADQQRTMLRESMAAAIDGIWPEEKLPTATAVPTRKTEMLYDAIGQLAAENDLQKDLKSKAMQLAADISQTRWLLYEQSASSISTPFLITTVLWLTIIFISFGLFAPFNGTVICTLMLCAMSVSAALFLVLEMDSPYTGIIQISSTPMRTALAALGQ